MFTINYLRVNPDAQDYYDVDLDEMAILTPDVLFSKYSGQNAMVKRHAGEYKNLCSTGASACIIIVVLGHDSIGNTLQGIAHLTDATNAVELLNKIIQMVKAAGSVDAYYALLGGNDDTDDVRQYLIEQAHRLNITLNDCQKNSSTADGFYTNVYLCHDEVHVVENQPDTEIEHIQSANPEHSSHQENNNRFFSQKALDEENSPVLPTDEHFISDRQKIK